MVALREPTHLSYRVRNEVSDDVVWPSPVVLSKLGWEMLTDITESQQSIHMLSNTAKSLL